MSQNIICPNCNTKIDIDNITDAKFKKKLEEQEFLLKKQQEKQKDDFKKQQEIQKNIFEKEMEEKTV